MARLFDDASSQYLSAANALVTAAPLSIGARIRTDQIGLRAVIAGVFDTAGDANYFSLEMAIGGEVNALTAATTAAAAATTLDPTIGVWHHALAVFASSSSRAVYLDGANKGTDTVDLTPAGIDATGIGARKTATPLRFWSGDLAEVAIWNVALNDAQALQLAVGVSPLLVVPESLVFYCPIIGKYSPEIDLISGTSMALTGTPTASAHPRVFYPSQKRVMDKVPAAGGADPEGRLTYGGKLVHGGLLGKGVLVG